MVKFMHSDPLAEITLLTPGSSVLYNQLNKKNHLKKQKKKFFSLHYTHVENDNIEIPKKKRMHI